MGDNYPATVATECNGTPDLVLLHDAQPRRESIRGSNPLHPPPYDMTAASLKSKNKSKNNNVDDVVDGEWQLMPQG